MQSFLPELNRFITFLTNRPSVAELGHRFTQDFMASLTPTGIGIYQVSMGAKLSTVFDQQISPAALNLNSLAISDLEGLYKVSNIFKDLNQSSPLISADNCHLLLQITNGNICVGLVQISFATALSDDQVEMVTSYAGLISFYCYPKLAAISQPNSLSELPINPLTPRQRQVLAGFIEGKTNHEMAVDLGFSISTIRHETMAIFKTLGASDRKGGRPWAFYCPKSQLHFLGLGPCPLDP